MPLAFTLGLGKRNLPVSLARELNAKGYIVINVDDGVLLTLPSSFGFHLETWFTAAAMEEVKIFNSVSPPRVRFTLSSSFIVFGVLGVFSGVSLFVLNGSLPSDQLGLALCSFFVCGLFLYSIIIFFLVSVIRRDIQGVI